MDDTMKEQLLEQGIGYSKKYDALYDLKTNEWLEEACDEDLCDFCKGRPPRHPYMEVVVNNDR